MRNPSGLFIAMALLGLSSLRGDETPDLVRVLCDPADPKTHCPGPDCLCKPDTLEITFDGDKDHVFEYDAVGGETVMKATVVMDTVSERVQGFSFGVAHDQSALTLLHADTPLPCTTGCLAFCVNVNNIQTCSDDPCTDRTDGGGWTCAIVLDGPPWPIALPLQRNTLAYAEYRLEKDVGEAGTLIGVSDRLAIKRAPRTALNVTIDGKSRRWSTAVDGWVRRGSSGPFRRGDADGSGRIDITDAFLSARIVLGHLFIGDVPFGFDCADIFDLDDDGEIGVADAVQLFEHLFRGGPEPPAPFATCGEDPTPDSLPCSGSNCVQ